MDNFEIKKKTKLCNSTLAPWVIKKGKKKMCVFLAEIFTMFADGVMMISRMFFFFFFFVEGRERQKSFKFKQKNKWDWVLPPVVSYKVLYDDEEKRGRVVDNWHLATATTRRGGIFAAFLLACHILSFSFPSFFFFVVLLLLHVAGSDSINSSPAHVVTNHHLLPPSLQHEKRDKKA